MGTRRTTSSSCGDVASHNGDGQFSPAWALFVAMVWDVPSKTLIIKFCGDLSTVIYRNRWFLCWQ
jgi:hypothetical protein